MEGLRGTTTYAIDTTAFFRNLARHTHVLIDIGTGDGRFVQHVARSQPHWCVIGIDACRENLRAASRGAPENAQFLIANALDLPRALRGAATHITINFPWGSLLRGLLDEASGLPLTLAEMARPGAALDVRLNAGALAEAGWETSAGGGQIRRALATHGFTVQPPTALDARALRALPTTWAKRLAFGRDPRGLALHAFYPLSR